MVAIHKKYSSYHYGRVYGRFFDMRKQMAKKLRGQPMRGNLCAGHEHTEKTQQRVEQIQQRMAEAQLE